MASVSLNTEEGQKIATPWPLLRAVEKKLGGRVTFDVCANRDSAKAERYFSLDEDGIDALEQDWSAVERTPADIFWCNPPFKRIAPWAKKCLEHSKALTTVLLTPAAVGADWFRDHVFRKADVLVLNGRVPFYPDRPKELYNKDVMVSVFGPGMQGRFDLWTWKKDIP